MKVVGKLNVLLLEVLPLVFRAINDRGLLAGEYFAIDFFLRVRIHQTAVIAFDNLMELGFALPENDYVVISTAEITIYRTHSDIKRLRLPSPLRCGGRDALRSD